MSEKASNIQIAGDHYRKFAIQPSEFIQRNELNWCEGNVVKYVCRHHSKNGVEDIKKAIHYLSLLLEWEYDPSAHVHGVGNATKTPAPLSLCATCARADVSCPIYPQEIQKCAGFEDKVADVGLEPLDFTLPTITQEGDISAVLAKHREEWQEWVKTEQGSMAELIEMWDVMQAEQTYYERGGEIGVLAEGMLSSLETCHWAGRPVMQAKRIMLIKNAARQKYSDEDCARILADV